MRNYGYGNPDPKDYMQGPPRVLEWHEHVICPNCKCAVALIQFIVNDYPGHSGPGVGTYLGCPACTWASPCLLIFSGSGAARA